MPADQRLDRRRSSPISMTGWVLAIAALYFGREVFIPLALAGLLAFLLSPASNRLERWGMRRTPAVLLVTAMSLAVVTALCSVVLGQIYNLAVEMPRYQQNVTSKIGALHLHSSGKLTSTVQMLTEVSREISAPESAAVPAVAPPVAAPVPTRSRRRVPAPVEPAANVAPERDPDQPITVRVEEQPLSVFGLAGRRLAPLVHPLTTAFIIVVFVVFMLLAQDDLRDRVIRLAGSSRMHATTVAMEDASRRVSRYLLMQFLVNVSYGGVVGMVLWGIGLPHPLLWSVLTCMLRFIPYVGILAAGAGPVLVAMAVSPHWLPAVLTLGVYLLLELLVSNVAEPMLYGASTGVSALAILVAAIFWTWLWGLPGLLLSTPLTVCLIVMGRHFPPLEFMGVLFGEETVLEPPQRLYQRLLAGDRDGAARVVEELTAERSGDRAREAICDSVLLPVLALVEEGRHSEELDAVTATRILQQMEELSAEMESERSGARGIAGEASGTPKRSLLCIPSRDLADEIAGELLLGVMSERYSGRVITADTGIREVLEAVELERPEVVCVVGVPPQAIRHVRLRCHQLRVRFPEQVVVACVLSEECDLSNVRGRIPMEDAQHVVCSMAQAREYLTALASPAHAVAAMSEAVAGSGETRVEVASVALAELEGLDVLDPTEEGVFAKLATSLAKSMDAPIALLNPLGGERTFWRAQCGFPEEAAGETPDARDLSLCSQPLPGGECVIVPDIAEDPIWKGDGFLNAAGIRFFAATPLRMQDGREIGCLAVMDTRPRQASPGQREILESLANSTMNAIELRGAPRPGEPVATTGEEMRAEPA